MISSQVGTDARRPRDFLAGRAGAGAGFGGSAGFSAAGLSTLVSCMAPVSPCVSCLPGSALARSSTLTRAAGTAIEPSWAGSVSGAGVSFAAVPFSAFVESRCSAAFPPGVDRCSAGLDRTAAGTGSGGGAAVGREGSETSATSKTSAPL